MIIRRSCEIIEIKTGNLIHINEDFTVERKGMLVSDCLPLSGLKEKPGHHNISGLF
jgi:hypothetical protein